MSSRQTGTSRSRRTTISYVVRGKEEPRNRSGINAVKICSKNRVLFTAGRDSIIRSWNVSEQATEQQKQSPYLKSMEHHTNWVNDIALCRGGRTLISASSDTTVKVWDTDRGFCMSTLRTHRDYVKSLGYAADKEIVASAGFDKQIFIWDVNTLTALTTANNTVTTSSLVGHKDSIYCVALNRAGTVLVSGSTECLLRVWDPRTCAKQMKLKGHTDNVKALALNAEGTELLSGSSDGTVKLWSLGQQRCIATYKFHDEGVWCIQTNDSFTKFYSSGRDRRVFETDLKTDNSFQLFREKAPVLGLELDFDEENDSLALWVAMTDSSISKWPIMKPPSGDSCSENEEFSGASSPLYTIPGAPGIVRIHVLNNKRHILTKDTSENVSVWDALKAEQVEDLGKIDFEEEVKKRFEKIFVPNWFTADSRTGMLNVHLDEADALQTWVTGRDVGLVNDDGRVNLGVVLLQALLEHWPLTYRRKDDPDKEPDNDEESEIIKGNGHFSFPRHTPIVFSESGDSGRTLMRLLIGDAVNLQEGLFLDETVPAWVTDVVVRRVFPKYLKVPFVLQPWASSSLRPLKRDRLSASDYLKVRKVCEHVYEKLFFEEELSGNGSKSEEDSNSRSNSEKAEEKIEILCLDQVLDYDMDLRTAKYFIWKSGSDLLLQYRLRHVEGEKSDGKKVSAKRKKEKSSVL